MRRRLDFRLKRYILWLYLGTIALFVVVKGGLRRLFAGHEIPGWLEVALYSFPNLAEAVIGLTNTVGLLFVARSLLRPRLDRVSDRGMYVFALLLAGTFVLTQEFKLHNLGGENLYDPYDVAASVLGLLGTLALFWRAGFADPWPRTNASGAS